MSAAATSSGVLRLGATGRTGGGVLTELLGRGVPVWAIARTARRLPAGVAHAPLRLILMSSVSVNRPARADARRGAVEGDASAYRTNDELVASLVKPDSTRMVDVAHFMADLATDEAAWTRWQGQRPVGRRRADGYGMTRHAATVRTAKETP